MNEHKRMNLGKVYFLYLFGVLFLQIIGLDGRSGTLETAWKIAVISCTMLYIVNKSAWRVSKQVVVPCMVYLIGQVLAYVFFSRATVNMFVNCAVVIGMTYMFVSMTLVGGDFKLEDMLWFIKAFIALMLYAVVYQLIMDPGAVFGALFRESVYSDMMHSFFDNKQTFGMFLFVAIIVSCLGMALTKKRRYLAAAVLFFAMLFVCSSRTSLLACAVFVVLMLVLFFRSNKNLAFAVTLLVLLFVLAVLVVPSLNRFLTEVLFDTEKTVEAREAIWEVSFRAMRGIKVLFGYGEGNVGEVIRGMDAEMVENAHNGFLHVFITGGLIKLILYMAVMILSLRSIVRIYKHNIALANVFLAAMVGLIAFSMGESLVLLDTSSPCVAASIVVVAFPIALDGYYRRKHETD